MLRTAILCFATALALLAAPAGAVDVGELAPDFTLQDLQGTSHTLSTYRGRVVLLGLVGYN